MATEKNWVGSRFSPRIGGSVVKRIRAHQEILDFAKMTFDSLVALEKKRHSLERLGIELYCRMDISVIDNDSGGLNYFVNEVERGPAASFWGSCESKTSPQSRIVDEVGYQLMEQLQSKKSRPSAR